LQDAGVDNGLEPDTEAALQGNPNARWTQISRSRTLTPSAICNAIMTTMYFRRALDFLRPSAVRFVLPLSILVLVARTSFAAGIPGSAGVATAHDVGSFSASAQKETSSGGAGQGSAVASPPVSANFAALGDDGTERVPDTHGAVGPNHLMVTLNSQVRIQDRAGGTLATSTLDGWWASFGCSNVSGPRVLYDPYGARWISTATGDRDTPFGLLVAVSQTSDPTGDWNRYFVAADPIALDPPNVGFNTNRIVVQVNSSDEFGNNVTLIYAFSKADLYANGQGLFTSWAFTNDVSLDVDGVTFLEFDLNQVPAVTLDRNLDVNYLMQDWVPNYEDPMNPGNFFGYLRIYSITGPVGSEVFHYTDGAGDPGPEPVSSPWWGDFQGSRLPQFGSANGIYAGDSRLVNVVYRNSALWAAHTVFLPAGASSPTHSAVQWWEVSPGGNVLQNGRIEDTSGNANVHYAYPSIGVNLDSDLLVGYSRFSASQFPSANYSFRFASDALGTVRSDTVLKAGEASYNPQRNGFTLNAWGAYSATVVDSLNDADLWTIQEYAAAPVGTNDHWGTWWGRVAPPVDLNLTMTDSPHTALIGGNITYTLVVTNLTTTNAASATRATLASGVKVTNTLPASLAYVSATSSQGSCNFSGGVVTCDLGNIAAKGQATITIVATTTVAGPVVNTATVFGNGQEIKPADNTAVTTTTVNPSADLALLMTNSPDPVTQNSNLTYTLIVTNRGPSPASSVTLIDTVPSGVLFLFPITSTQGTNTASGNTVTFTLGTINPGASAIGTVVVRAATTGIVTNRASVSSPTGDPLTNNNSGATSARINVPPTIQSIVNRTINEDATDSFPFTISDPETPAASLLVSVSSANQALIPNSNLVLSGTGSPRTLTITPLANQFGSAAITIAVTDNDGVTSRTTWTETVTSVNDRPTLDPIAAVAVNEDSGPHTNFLTGITTGAPNEPDPLTVSATSSNPALIPNPTVNYINGNTTGTLVFTPATNAFGTVTISVTVNDNQAANNVVTQAFTVTINAINDPPTLNAIANTNINEDASQLTIVLGGITSGAANEPDTLGVTALSSDTSIIPNPTVTYTSPNSSGTIAFTPLPTKFGMVTITVTVDDHQPSNNIVQKAFLVTVSPVNDPPTLDAIGTVTINEDAPLQIVNLTGITTGATNEFDTLTVTNVFSNNHSLIPDPTVTYTSPNATGSLSFTPIPTRSGVATISVSVSDGQPSNNIVTRTFTVIVNAVNDPPTLDPINPLNINEDSGPRTINLTGITTGATNEADTLTVSATSDNPALIPSPGSVSYTAGSSTASFVITPATNAFGAAVITVTVNDNQPSNNIVRQSFTVTVAPVNDPPTLNFISNVSTNEDAPSLTVSLAGISSGATNEPDFLTVNATSDNPAVVPDPIVNYTNPNGTGTLTFAPVPNAFGVANITVTVNDGQPTNNTFVRMFSVTINAVNDPPTLNSIGNVAFDEDSGPQLVNLSGITSGAPNEFQTLTVNVTSNSNPALLTNFVVTYSSPANAGTLSFNTVTNAFGTSVVTVTVTDGGTSNNFVRQTFMVTVNSVNDLPVLSAFADPVATDEDVPLTLFFTASDVETPGTNLVLTAESSNEEVISADGITFGFSGPNRTVTLRPLTNQFGSAFITITLTDGNGGSTSAGFELDVNPVNDPPTISTIANRVTTEDVPLTVLFTVDDVESLPDDLTVTATSSNQVVVPSANLVLGGSGANRSLTITPGTNQFGSSIIRIIATDGESFTTNSFSFTVNGLPTISSVADQGTDEDTAITIPFTIGDFETAAASLLVSGNSSNPSLVSAASFTFGGSASNRTVTIRPLTNQFGAAVITLTVTDGNNTTGTTSFNLFVNAVNDPPTISAISFQSINEDTATAPIAFTIGDVETPAGSLTVTGSSSNPALVPNANLQFAGGGSNRTVTVTPASNQTGTATITVTVRDDEGRGTSTNFLVIVNAVNDPPTVAGLADQTINEDTPLAIPFTVGDVDTALTSLTFSAGSSNPTLVPVANVVFGGSGANRTATITPATNQFGTTVITINVNDGVATTSATFNLTVLSVNDLPTISTIANQTISEDTVSPAIPFTVGDVETAAASLSVVGSSSNPALVPNSKIVIGGSGSSRTVTITPATNQFGTTTISITVTDGNGGAVTNSFLLTVNPVNDPPTISGVGPQTVSEDTSISVPFTVGDPDTAIAALTVTATSTNTTLVPVANILPDGYGTNRSVTITPAANQFGTTAITLTVSDGFLTATSSFVLTVVAVNDPPTLDPIPNLFTNVTPGTVSVNLTGVTSGAANETQTLTVTNSFTNPGLFSNVPSVSYASPGTTAVVSFKPANGAVGSSTITVTVSDGSATFSRSFTVYVKPSANIAPTITGITNQTVNEDTPTPAIPFTIRDDTTPVASLGLTAYSSNTNLAPVANIVFGGSGSNRTVTVTPAPNQSGTSTITISLTDTNFGGTNTSFLLTVTAVNDAPTISQIPPQTINEDTSTGPIPFMIGDVETAAGSLTLSSTSSNLTLVPAANVVFGGNGTNRAVTVTPATNQTGTTLITVTVSDGLLTRSTNFLVTVNPVNDPPTISTVADQTVAEDTTTAAIAFTVGDIETAATSLNVTSSSSNPVLVPNANITLGGSGSSRTVAILPATNQYGTAIITLSVSDGTATASTSFMLTVTPVNEPPTLDALANVFINQGAGLQTINLSGITAGPNENQLLAVSAISSNPGLIPNPTVNYTSPNSTGTLTFTPVPGTNGAVTILVTVNDGQSLNNLLARTFTVNVNAAPLVSDIADQVINEDTATGPIAFTVSDLETPAASLTINPTSSNPALVPNGNIALGGSGANRTVTISPAANQFGFTTITLAVSDTDGTTTTKSFVLSVTSINDRPTLNPIANLTLIVDAGPQNLSLTGISSGAVNENQTLIVQANSSNPALIPNPTVNYTSPNSLGSLSFTPAPGAIGSAMITVAVQDDGGTRNGGQNTVSRSFQVTVTPFVPVLSIVSIDPDVLVFWSTNAVGFTLQGRDSFSSPWAPVTNDPVRVGAQFYVTNSADGNRFYRLIK